jgi:GNAT superfamily N-acetyltransferase
MAGAKKVKFMESVKITSFVRDSKEDFEFGPFHEWLKAVEAVATVHRNASIAPIEIGKATAFIVDRAVIRNNFHASMKEPHDETMELALEIFDRHGRLKRELIEHAVRKGSGVWGEELGKGNFVLLHDVQVQTKWRRKGIGSKLVLHILDKAMTSKVNPKFVFASPGITGDDRTSRLRGQEGKAQQLAFRRSAMDSLNIFFRYLKFRRVGLTNWFALARDECHISRQLPSAKDMDPVRDDLSDSDSGDETVVMCDSSMEENGTRIRFHQTRMTRSEAARGEYGAIFKKDNAPMPEDPRATTAILKRLHPLHRAIEVLEDKACLDFLQSHTGGNSTDELDLAATNGRGETILHAAARASKPESLSWILESPNGAELACIRDHIGYTPLEALQAKAECDRVYTEYGFENVKLLADKFDGHDDGTIACLLNLLGAKNATLEEHERVKFGCSCGLCVSGFLSPRMFMRLRNAAEVLYKLLAAVAESGADGHVWCSQFKGQLAYLPDDLKPKFRRNAVLRKVFTALTGAISKCLSQNIVPCRKQVVIFLSETTSGSQVDVHYFRKGGSVAAVVNAIIDLAKNQAIKKWNSTGVLQLPMCRNDDEFEFVRRHCVDDNPTKEEPEPSIT